MSIVLGFLAGILAGGAVWVLSAPILSRPDFQRTNFRGNPIATAGGLVVILAVVAVEVVLTIASVWEPEPSPRRLVLSATIAFGALGLLDDLRGDGSVSGFKGHLRSLARGQLTTGGVKLLGGGIVALALGWSIERSIAVAVLDGALIALVANVANLLDRAPGRTTKVTVLVFAAFALATGATELFATAVVLGAGFAVLLPELREDVMLGDTGANVLGAALGVGIAVTASVPTKAVVAAVALGLNLLSEVRSYSAIIERTPPLRYLDRLGRRT